MKTVERSHLCGWEQKAHISMYSVVFFFFSHKIRNCDFEFAVAMGVFALPLNWI